MVQTVLDNLRSAAAAMRSVPALRVAAAIDSVAIDRSASSSTPWLRPALLRVGLILACAASVGVAFHVGDPAASLRADPALAHLLRGMAAIKSTLVLAAIGACLWRLGWAISGPIAVAYIAGCAALAGSTMLIWQLTAIALAALVFQGAALGMLVVGWRER
jgi:hypothetical protein